MVGEHPQQSSRLSALMESRERERARWVREVQHEMAQTLTGLRCHLAVIQRSGDPTATDRASQAELLVDELAQWLRDLAIRVRPPMLDDLGLGPTLSWYANHLEQQTGKSVRLGLRGLCERLPYLSETAAFRAVSTLLPAVLRGDDVKTLECHVAIEDEALWLMARWDGAMPPGGAMALADVSEWLSWMGGAARSEEINQVSHLTVMIPSTAPMGG